MFLFVFKHETSYGLRISDWSSDVCSSDLIFYLLRAGCPWQLLPDSFPPLRTVYQWFCTLRDDGVFESLNHRLVRIDRIRTGREPAPRSAERRVGKACVRTCRSRWSPSH